MDWSTLYWSVIYFVAGYAGIMQSRPGYFSWAAVYSGMGMVIAFHTGKALPTGGAIPAVWNNVVKPPVQSVLGLFAMSKDKV